MLSCKLPLHFAVILPLFSYSLANKSFVLENFSFALIYEYFVTFSWIASSQFQPSDARRVFPCFDEPGMKSIFQAHIIRRKDTPTLSNMPEQKTTKM